MAYELTIQIISILTAISCSILGTFLVLRKMAMLADAITHTALLGIVIFFLITKDINSFLLIFGAGLIGVVTVLFIEMLKNTNLIKEDSAIGVITTFLFSIAVILISKKIGNVHIDNDSILMGEITFAPLNKIEIFGYYLPKSIVVSLVLIFINLMFIFIFFKELKISTFDFNYAVTLGLFPVLINYIFITLVSVTTVASFEAVGAILVISFLVGPPSIAYMICNDLKLMIIFSIIISIISSYIGVKIAIYYNVSISGTISVVIGILFLIIMLISPKSGIIKNVIIKKMLNKKINKKN